MKSKIKILLITSRTDIGGGPKSVLMLSRYLPDDFEIYIACPTDAPYFDLYRSTSRVKGFFQLPHRKFYVHKYLGLALFVWKNGIQIINSNGTGAGLYGRLLKILCPKIKVVHTFRGFNTKKVGSLRHSIYLMYEKIFSLFTDLFINVSHGEQDLCLGFKVFKKDRSVVIHNGIEPLKRNSDFSVDELKGKFVVTTLSRFDFPKNMFDSYRIAMLLKEYSEIVFLWIGDGDDKSELEQLSKKENANIVFTGFKNNISDYLSLSDLYLSTSVWEGLPLSLLEASSMGVPVVASDIIGNNEVVSSGVNGFLFKSGDVAAAAKYILQLYEDRALRKRFSEAIENNFTANFSVNIMATNSAVQFRKILNA